MRWNLSEIFFPENILYATVIRIVIITGMICHVPAFAAGQTNATGSLNADSARYYLQYGIDEKQKGRYLVALNDFEKAFRYDSSNKIIVTELASACYQQRRYNKALELYKNLEVLGDKSDTNYKRIMLLSFQLKKNNDVLFYANKLKAVNPSEKVSFYVGKVNYDADNYGEAIKYLQMAENEDTTNADVPYMIGHSYADMMNYKKAVGYYKRAIDLDTTKSHWVYELGLIYYAMNDSKETLKYFLLAADRGYKMDNDYMENLGIAYLDAGELENGVKILLEILKRKPADINILTILAEAHYYAGKYSLAMEYYDRILEADKRNAPSLYMIGMCYQRIGGKENAEKGVRLCDIAIEMDPALKNLKQKKMVTGL